MSNIALSINTRGYRCVTVSPMTAYSTARQSVRRRLSLGFALLVAVAAIEGWLVHEWWSGVATARGTPPSAEVVWTGDTVDLGRLFAAR